MHVRDDCSVSLWRVFFQCDGITAQSTLTSAVKEKILLAAHFAKWENIDSSAVWNRAKLSSPTLRQCGNFFLFAIGLYLDRQTNNNREQSELDKKGRWKSGAGKIFNPGRAKH